MLVVDGVEMIDVREAATLAQRSQETVRRWVWSGRVRARKEGNRLLIRRDDVRRLAGQDDKGSIAPSSTLAEWRDELSRDSRSGSGTAADLVIDDRRTRSEQRGHGRASR
jgi:excisionase family DNA binding protein